MTYTYNVANSVSSVILTPFATESHATITVNGNTVANGTAYTVNSLVVGSTPVYVNITAQDGTTKKNYVVNVIRAQPATSTDATLKDLQINGTSISGFNPSTLTYTYDVANSVSSVILTPFATESHATITVNGNTVANGTAYTVNSLVVGSTPVYVNVTAQDGTTKKNYVVNVIRAQPATSTDATLKDLQINGTTISGFSPSTLTYTYNVANSVSSVILTPFATESHATITVNGNTVANGTAYTVNSLVVGSTPVYVNITAQDGTTKKNYVVNVIRAQPATSTDATLKDLQINGTTITGFNSNTLTYTYNVANSVSSVILTPFATESHATITVNGNTVANGTAYTVNSLVVGSTPVYVNITAQDGTTKKNYVVNVIRAQTVIIPNIPEPQSNIAAQDVSYASASPGTITNVSFPANNTSVLNLSFIANDNVGAIVAVVDLLFNQSSLTTVAPSGSVYQFLDIWVQDSNAANVENIANATIGFRVAKLWIQSSNINQSSITLNRYSDGVWSQLPTVLVGDDGTYLYFIAQTPGFSPFAITGNPASVQASPLLLTKIAKPTTYTAAGQKITYTYTVTNTGTESIKNIKVTDDKVSVKIVGSTLTAGRSLKGVGTYTITQADMNAGSVTNSATASGKSGPESHF